MRREHIFFLVLTKQRSIDLQAAFHRLRAPSLMLPRPFVPSISAPLRISRFLPQIGSVTIAALLACASLALGDDDLRPSLPKSDGWHLFARGIDRGISGMAFVESRPGELTLLGVLDNKLPQQDRVVLITRKVGAPVRFELLAWPDASAPPVDLEAITAVPGSQDRFVAATSNGMLYQLSLDRWAKKLSLIGVALLPNAGAGREFEAFNLAVVGNRIIAVWAHRGSGPQPAMLCWSAVDDKLAFGPVEMAEVRVQWPVENVRHISDLKIDASGFAYIAAASDAGDDGPFASAVYVAGVFGWNGIAFQFSPAVAPPRLYPTEDHKIEALTLIPGSTGGLALATDDENAGGSIKFTWEEAPAPTPNR